jgi:hypothetical protein
MLMAWATAFWAIAFWAIVALAIAALATVTAFWARFVSGLLA